jgi:hypothetical protein
MTEEAQAPSDLQRAAPKPVDWFDIRQKWIAGLLSGLSIAAVLAVIGAFGTIAWNTLTGGTVLRMLGGVPRADVEAIVGKAVLQQIATFGVPSTGAVVAFDRGCPPGWIMAQEMVGNAIVGVGAYRDGEMGFPSATSVSTGTGLFAGQYYDVKNKNLRVSDAPAGYDPYSEPISRFVPNVRSAQVPTFMPLEYCRVGASFDFQPDDSLTKK